jgi:hypothetical protein
LREAGTRWRLNIIVWVAEEERKGRRVGYI